MQAGRKKMIRINPMKTKIRRMMGRPSGIKPKGVGRNPICAVFRCVLCQAFYLFSFDFPLSADFCLVFRLFALCDPKIPLPIPHVWLTCLRLSADFQGVSAYFPWIMVGLSLDNGFPCIFHLP